MKFFLIAVCATVAFAAPEAIWSEDGEYKIVDKEPLAERVTAPEPEVKIASEDPADIKYAQRAPLLFRYLDQEPLEVKDEEDKDGKIEKKVRLGYVPIPYDPFPFEYRRLVLRGYEPFTYHYQQISH